MQPTPGGFFVRDAQGNISVQPTRPPTPADRKTAEAAQVIKQPPPQ